MKTPEEVKAQHASITKQGAVELAMFLNKWGGVPDKDFVVALLEHQKDKLAPSECCRHLLASAYD